MTKVLETIGKYFFHIFLAIFFPKSIYEEWDYESIKIQRDSLSKQLETIKEYQDAGWANAKKYAEQADNLVKEYNELVHKHNAQLTLRKGAEKKVEALELKLSRYYKTGKNIDKK